MNWYTRACCVEDTMAGWLMTVARFVGCVLVWLACAAVAWALAIGMALVVVEAVRSQWFYTLINGG